MPLRLPRAYRVLFFCSVATMPLVAGCAEWLLGAGEGAGAPSAERFADGALVQPSTVDGSVATADGSVRNGGSEAGADAQQPPTTGGDSSTSPAVDAARPPLVCVAPTLDCDGDGLSCETDTSSDVKHCGQCLRMCRTDAHGTASCVDGDCELSCDDGYSKKNSVCVKDAVQGNACTSDVYARYSNLSICFLTTTQLCKPALSCADCTGSRCCAEQSLGGPLKRSCIERNP